MKGLIFFVLFMNAFISIVSITDVTWIFSLGKGRVYDVIYTTK